jgi:hypothetical protein
MTIKKSKIKQTGSGSWIFPDGISLPPVKFAKLMRGPRAAELGGRAQGRKGASSKKI